MLETVRAIVRGRHASLRPPGCPVEGCDQALHPGTGRYACPCSKAEILYETDAFRFAEQFSNVSSNGETHGEVRHALEVVCLLNILRYFAKDRAALAYLRDAVFILDGPLALFGHPAWLTPYVREELGRLNALCRREGFDLALFGFEKSGAFVEHFDQLDICAERGPRGRYPNGTVFAPDAAYINRNIALRPASAKPHGEDTYFGRKLFYKTASGGHAVVTTAMVNQASQDFRRCDAECFPRLGDMLDVLDHLATYFTVTASCHWFVRTPTPPSRSGAAPTSYGRYSANWRAARPRRRRDDWTVEPRVGVCRAMAAVHLRRTLVHARTLLCHVPRGFRPAHHRGFLSSRGHGARSFLWARDGAVCCEGDWALLLGRGPQSSRLRVRGGED